MKLSAPDSAIALEAAILLKLTLEYHAHKVTMVRGVTMSGGARSCFSQVLFLPLLYAYFFSYVFLDIASLGRFNQMRVFFGEIFQVYRKVQKMI